MTREDEIFRKLKNGDETAVDELVGLYYSDILRYCRYHVPEESLAEDEVQETFLKVFRYFDDYRHRGKFRAFLYQVAANTCTDLCRKRRWESVDEEIPDEERGMEDTENETDFRRMIRSLPRELEEIVYLRFSQEVKLREIAEITGTPLRTVQSRLRRALDLLKKEMKEGDRS